ncbi:MAG: repair protein MmcB-related protein [Rhodospirillales bacterium]|jgi:hypothetical protein|nr:repair protein MmcB-related protein [Rhodospirillales bacterium]
MSIADDPAGAAPEPSLGGAALLARGVSRALGQLGCASLHEFSLASGRRADVIALGRGGEIAIVEVKSSIADFRADRKWPEYWEYCDRLYFAVAAGFPHELIPPECGLILADPFGAAILRASELRPLNAARRRVLTLRFAMVAAQRLRRLLDPGAVDPGLV